MRLLLLLALLPLAAKAQVAADCGAVRVLSSELRESEAMTYCKYAVAERKKVEDYWGATWTEPIRIEVASKYKISRALVPGWRGNRGFMEMPLTRMQRGTGSLLHEIVHIYAPHENRFLAEGFAVYLQQKLGGNRAFPNFGDPLARLAGRHSPDTDLLRRLNEVRTPAPLDRVVDGQMAYILAGSFVEFLIERHGLPKFRKLYESANYDAAYGSPFEELVREWRASLQ